MQTSKSAERGDQNGDTPLTIVVVGASGDLARKKIFPALFSLFSQGFLPERFQVMGFARSAMSHERFREHITENLTCRYVPERSCADYMDRFLARCFYASGQYGSRDDFLHMYEVMRAEEGLGAANRIYYMSIPPFLFMEVARSLGNAGLVVCDGGAGWSRAVIEKPFGRDRASSDELVQNMTQVFREDQTFRIDHYLGKEIVQNLIVLRFANAVFDPIWNRSHIESVRVMWGEDIGVEDRGDYYDHYGILRDVVQNHLLQIISLLAMEQPESLDPQQVRDAKVRVLKDMAPLTLDDLVTGQYQAAEFNGAHHKAYLDEKAVPPDSRTPTFAAAILHINNPRWDSVPFFVYAGKGLDRRFTEIRIRFRALDHSLFAGCKESLPANELVIRVQPDEAIFYEIINKAPGLDMKLVETELNLRYEAAFDAKIPEAYESLLLDVSEGDHSLFIRADELAAAWDVFTPALHELEEKRIQPEPYAFGSKGPDKAFKLAARYGVGIF